MPRSDLLLNLVRAGTAGDQSLLRRTLEALVAEERAKHHHVLAERLAEFLNGPAADVRILGKLDEGVQNLLYEIKPRRNLEDLVLPSQLVSECQELVEEHQRIELLRSYNLEPRHRILLVGPPGNGKTSLAEAIAYHLTLPMYSIRYEGVVGSYLGETSSRLRRLFDFVRTRQCILFLDEFETLGKERGDTHETGEIKRVVSSLLLQIDALPTHVIVITATNHPELLDRAVWRRFQIRWELPAPRLPERAEWFRRLQARLKEPLVYPPRTLALGLTGTSFSELEEFTNDVLRAFALRGPNVELKHIISEKLDRWKQRPRPLS